MYLIRKIELIYEQDEPCRISFKCKTPVKDLIRFRQSLIRTHHCNRVLLIYEER